MFLLGIICAADRLRMGMRWGHTQAPTVGIMQAAELCVSTASAPLECPDVLYYNAQLLHLPGTALPPFWAPPVRGRSPVAPEWLSLLDAEHLVAGLLDAGDGVRLTETRVFLSGNSTETVLLETAGGGTIRLITLNVSTALTSNESLSPFTSSCAAKRRRILHSGSIRLRAWWDGGVTADGGWPAGGVRRGCAEVNRARPSVDFPLSALWGPPNLYSRELALHPTLLVGETAKYGLHIALPMPFWRSACVMLKSDGVQDFDAKDGGSCKRTAVMDVRVSWADSAEYSEDGQAGYFFAPLGTTMLGEGTLSPNIIANVGRLSGSLIGMAHVASADSKFFVEGDILIRVDGCPTPAVWSSGYEDWFLGSHAYHCGEFTGTHHAYAKGNAGERLQMWQIRVLTADAVPFRSSLVVSVEGGGWEYSPRAVIQCLALIYAWPAPPLALTDYFCPSDEISVPAPPHAYEITAADGGVEEFALASHIAGFGLEHSLHMQGDRIPAETFLVRSRALAFSRPARVAFRVSVAANNNGVILRRLNDLRRPAGVAVVHVDGAAAGTWLASDRYRE